MSSTIPEICEMFSEYMVAEDADSKKEWLDLIVSTLQEDMAIMYDVLDGRTVLDMSLQTQDMHLVSTLASMLDSKDRLLERAKFFAKQLGLTSVEWSMALQGNRTI